MSGEKCAQASLRQELEERLARHLSFLAALNADLAAVAGVEEQGRRLMRELGSEARTYMKEDCEELDRLSEDSSQLRARLARVAEQAESVDRFNLTEALVEKVAELRRQVEDAQPRLRALAETIEKKRQAMSDGLEAARNRHHRDWMVVRQVIREISGLGAELNSRLESPRGGMRWVADEARALRDDLTTGVEALERSAEPRAEAAQETLSRFRSRFNGLVAKADDLALRDARRRRVAAIFDQALRESGFDRTFVRDPELVEDPIRFLHESRKAASIHTDIPLEGELLILMQGREGEDALKVTPSAHCDLDLERVVARARELGLVISNVMVKGPGGGWNALRVRGAEGGRARKKETGKPVQERSVKPPR